MTASEAGVHLGLCMFNSPMLSVSAMCCDALAIAPGDYFGLAQAQCQNRQEFPFGPSLANSCCHMMSRHRLASCQIGSLVGASWFMELPEQHGEPSCILRLHAWCCADQALLCWSCSPALPQATLKYAELMDRAVAKGEMDDAQTEQVGYSSTVLSSNQQ